jgi:pimeloyl-ACP methyl ester carboxylesterase
MSPLMRNLVLILLLAVIVTGIGFRMLASSREQYDPIAAAGQNAQFAEVRGLRIHYREWGPKSGKPLLLVHGAMAWSRTWRDIAAPLGEEGYRVIAFDLPPFGFSDRPSARIYSRSQQAAMIAGFADAIGLKRFVLAGHSFGAGATVEAAFSMPDRVERLILISAALEPGAKDDGSLVKMFLGAGWLRDIAVASTFTNPLAIDMGLKRLVYDKASVTPEHTNLYTLPLFMRGTSSAVGDWMMTGLYGNETRSPANDPDAYARFVQSVLLVWGKEDTVTPPKLGERLAGLFPNARLEVLDGVAHIPHVEKPEDVAALVGEFLGNASPRRPKPLPLVSAAGLRGSVVADD